jgi:hypothetical protein
MRLLAALSHIIEQVRRFVVGLLYKKEIDYVAAAEL